MSETGSDANSPDEPDRVIIRDNRKIDPVTGQARNKPAEGSRPAHGAADSPSSGAGDASEEDVPKAEALLLEERTRDLQRVQAEYANYRKRADRDRLAAGELAVGRTLSELLPVLDDIDRARAHGDLTGALKAVADHLETAFAKLGLVGFGDVGDPFDPALHEAVMHDESDAVTEPTCTTILRRGYRHGERLLRAAMVGVTDPIAPAAGDSAPAAGDSAPAAGDSAPAGEGTPADDATQNADGAEQS